MKTITLSVQQFNTFVKNIFDVEEFLIGVGIFGEVSNLKISAGNVYFDLKDENAVISCIKFGVGDYNIDFENGEMITVYGKPNFYVKTGKLSFIVSSHRKSGIGELYQKFIELKNKLESEGYFKQEAKKSICKFAKNIGVVTSETGAVIRDIINVTRKKNPKINLIVYPSKVQGIGAEDEIVNGILYFNSRNDIDTIVIARGGGSPEDMAPFNTEKLVKSIYNSRIPIISAVGHETDFTLCDFASDLRVPTPSVAAEVAVYDYYEESENIFELCEQCSNLIATKIKKNKETLRNISIQNIDKLKLKITNARHKLNLLNFALASSVNFANQKRKEKLNLLINAISKMNPLEILKQGYASISVDGKAIKKVADLKTNEKINLTMKDGSALAVITEIKIGDK